MDRVEWKKNMNEAEEEIRGGTRQLLLFFYAPEDCEGSRRTMDEVLTDHTVVNLIERSAAPLKFDISADPEMAKRYRVDLTPAFVIAGEDGVELERWVGYLPAAEFKEQLMLSKGLAAFHLNRYRDAMREFEEIVNEHSASELAPEAEFYLGIAGYRASGDTDVLAEACDNLKTNHPGSLWTKRCSAFSHLTRTLNIQYVSGGSLGGGAY